MISIATEKKIVTNSMFEVISFGISSWDLVLLDLHLVKYYVQTHDGYAVIYKDSLCDFLSSNVDKTIVTNDTNIVGQNIIHSEFSDKKVADLISHKVANGIFSAQITPLYIEKVSVTVRKK